MNTASAGATPVTFGDEHVARPATTVAEHSAVAPAEKVTVPAVIPGGAPTSDTVAETGAARSAPADTVTDAALKGSFTSARPGTA